MATSSVTSRPLRFDAERNRAAILAVAAKVYAERGCETSLEEIAKLAGLGVGTVYRRFPNKALLIEALLEDSMHQYAEATEAFSAQADTHPWDAFTGHVRSLLSLQARDRAFSEVITDPTSSSEVIRHLHRRALRASLALTAKARSAGVLRDDFRHRDLLLLAHANHGVVAAGRTFDLESSLRLAELTLAGMRRNPSA